MTGSNLARRTSPARPTIVASRDGPCLEGMESPASPNPGSGEAVGKRGPAARAERATEGGVLVLSSSKSSRISDMVATREKGWGSDKANPSPCTGSGRRRG
jgi:hypothetical protein